MKWNFEDKPTEIGWYPVLGCYDPEEGLLPFCAYFDGARWGKIEGANVVAFGDLAESDEEAASLAFDHAP